MKKVYEYQAMIETDEHKKGAFVRFPYDVRKEFGKGRMKATAYFDGIEYHGSIVNMGVKNTDGSICYIIGVRKDIRAKINKTFDDMIEVRIEVEV